jgi:hypothetical protein
MDFETINIVNDAYIIKQGGIPLGAKMRMEDGVTVVVPFFTFRKESGATVLSARTTDGVVTDDHLSPYLEQIEEMSEEGSFGYILKYENLVGIVANPGRLQLTEEQVVRT